jgi:hypothetical protein
MSYRKQEAPTRENSSAETEFCELKDCEMMKKTLRSALMNQQLKTEIVRRASDVKQEVKSVFD